MNGQRVIYSPVMDVRTDLRFEVAGKAANYYWLLKENREKIGKRKTKAGAGKEQIFEIYDDKLNLAARISPLQIPDSGIKEYLIAGQNQFDRVILLVSQKSTLLLLERFDPAGSRRNPARVIGSLPFHEVGNSFLLVRSENKTKILLLGFESVPSSSPRLHALLFDQDWNQISYTVYQHPFITQPTLQDDFICYPVESFDIGPVKLSNNGQWLMTSPSRTGHDFLLFHFCEAGVSFSYKQVKLPAFSTMEDVDLCINNERNEAYVGILSRFKYTALKNVRVAHYSLDQEKFEFDSSYSLNTLVPGKLKNGNLTKEKFLALPGNGFILLKEYGRVFNDVYEDSEYNNQWDPDMIFAAGFLSGPQNLAINRDGYTRFSSLGGPRSAYDRGDLSIFYFPTRRVDSCWSGIINEAQATEFNSPFLSYLVIPVNDKLFFVYNSLSLREGQFGTTTVMDHHGQPLSGESILFWRFNNTLNFQQSRQIAVNEVAIPYARSRILGFAILRF